MRNYVSINANDVKKMFKVCGACIDADGVRECLQYIKIEVRGQQGDRYRVRRFQACNRNKRYNHAGRRGF